MKAWRQQSVQERFYCDIGSPEKLRGQRLGRLCKAAQVKIVAGPSFLLQALLIRAGVMKGD